MSARKKKEINIYPLMAVISDSVLRSTYTIARAASCRLTVCKHTDHLATAE